MANYDASRGVWKIYADTTPPGGKRSRMVRQVKAPDTKAGRKIAEAREVELQTEVAARLAAAGGQIERGTFRHYAEAWIAGKVANRWRGDTEHTTRAFLGRYVYPSIGSRELDAITADDLAEMFASWRLMPSTQRRVYGIVHAIFETAWRRGALSLVKGNPMDRIDPVGGPAAERDIPTAAEVRQIWEATPTAAQRIFVMMAATTGARRGSLINLRWRHFDLDAGTVWYQVTKESHPYTIHLPAELVAALVEHRRQAAEVALALGERARLDDLYLFTNDGGLTHWQPASASRVFRLAAEASGLGAFHLHDLRHYHATTCLQAAIPAKDVAARLGCTEANVIKTYSHRVPSANDARAAAVVGAALFGAAS